MNFGILIKIFFHNRIIYGIITLSFLINVALCEIEYHKDVNETCSVNLQCETGCCQEDICVETIKCKEFRNWGAQNPHKT